MSSRAAISILLASAVAAGAAFASPSAGAGPPSPRRTAQKKPTAAPAVSREPGAPGGPTDFSGLWKLDDKSSAMGTYHMDKAELEVTQKGDHIWIQPLGNTRQRVLAEEVVVDGRSYEKKLGKEMGTLTARWGNDASSLWLEVVAGTDEDPRAAVQRSVWRLSSDRSTWVRETISVNKGTPKRSRLVFRRQPAAPAETTPGAPTPKPAKPAKPARPRATPAPGTTPARANPPAQSNPPAQAKKPAQARKPA